MTSLKAGLFIILLLPTISFLSNNLIINGNFESASNEWSSWFDSTSGYNGTFQINNTDVYSGSASGQVTINTIGSDSNFHKIMARNISFELEENVNYKVTFFLKSNSVQNFMVQIHKDTSPYTQYSSQTFTAATNWEAYSFTFVSPVSTTDVRFAFKLGNSVATYYFDDIEMFEFTEVYDSLIDPDYSIDWSRCGVPGGIPNVPATINVLDYGAIGDGSKDNLSAFEAALSAANIGEAVFIPAGTYRINGSLIIHEGRVLRGECPSNTRLEFAANSTCIFIMGDDDFEFQPVIGGYSKGSNTITVNNPSVFSVGDYVEMQQENDPVLMYTDPYLEPSWNQTWAANAVGQLFTVTRITGNQLELDRPVFYGLNPNLNPEVRHIGLIEETGIEDLYLERINTTEGATIHIENAARCWVKNIESNMTYLSHVNLLRTIDCEVRGSYIHHSHDYGGGGHGYGVAVGLHSTSALVENNVFEHLRHAMIIYVGATGNVYGYNYSKEPHWQHLNIPSDISMHGHFSTMNLFEGNILEKAYFSDWWGPVGPGNTMFRNRVTTSNITVADHSHHQNVIANELTGDGAIVEIESTVQNTWSHSNNENGLIKAVTTAEVPASLYLTNVPDFLAGYPFPVFGPEMTLGANSIPAEHRFEQAEELCKEITNEDCNFINNADFSNDLSGWSNWRCSAEVVSGKCQISDIEEVANPWDVAIVNGDFNLENGELYEVSFDAFALENDRTINVKVGLSEDPFTNYMYQTIQLSTKNQRFTIPFIMDHLTTNKGRLEFHVGKNTTGLMLDNIEVGCTIICPMVLDFEYLTPEGIYQAGSAIYINTDVSNAGNVELRAGELISLESGFSTGSSNFEAKIESCEN